MAADFQIVSMTGHGEAVHEENGHRIAVEIRSVNNRFLKVSTRVSEGFYSLEPRIEDFARRSLRRGSVVISIRVQRESGADDFRINEAVLTSYQHQLQRLANAGEGRPINPESLVLMPGVVEQQTLGEEETEAIWPAMETALRAAFSQLDEMRHREGDAMAEDLMRNRNAIAGELDHIRQRSPEVVAAYQTRLTDRINNLLKDHEVKIDSQDVVREVGIFADRCDISEEVVRLTSHLDQFEKIMADSDSTGKKLDFLTQEMFRETNTIGSKANDAQIARHVVEIKSLIERIREMTQNIE